MRKTGWVRGKGVNRKTEKDTVGAVQVEKARELTHEAEATVWIDRRWQT